MSWKRPDNVPYPSVWHTFQAKDTESDQLVTYRVQDLPEDRFEEAIAHMMEYFVYDEPTCRAKNIVSEQQSVDEIADLWREFVKFHLVLVCFKEGSDEIAGMNMLYVSQQSDKEEYQCKGKIWKCIYDLVDYTMKEANVYERYGVDKYLGAMGLSVAPNYRGRGIATEILRARIPLCKGVGLPLTSTCFTAIGSQVAAAKAGYEETYVVSYEDMAKVDDRFVFPNITTKYVKCMSKRVE
uniref:N-acetyltransferase domain-containing protein n=1 Tax=Anopheles stephensi TaxID=30069 RepID=A0A182Y8Q0_ANOST